MKKIEAKDLQENFFNAIGQEWMLITSGDKEKFNTMTASWGGIGFMWNKPVAYIFVRPERYTNQFIENQDRFSLTFFKEKYHDALVLCGKKSGRDCDKVAETGLTPQFTEQGTPYFKEARMMLECRKYYSVKIDDGKFIEESIPATWYQKDGVHIMYIAEIENCIVED